MATAIRTIGHEDRLSLVDHLEELRTRLIVSAVVLAVAFGVCLWQNHALLHIIDRPLEHQTRNRSEKGKGRSARRCWPSRAVLGVARDTQGSARDPEPPPAATCRRGPCAARRRDRPLLRADVAKIPRYPTERQARHARYRRAVHDHDQVVSVFALVFSLPVILFELYGFVLPALSPSERRIALPAARAIPFLFAAGVLFGYFVVLPAARALLS